MGFVRMNADCCIHERILIGELHCRVEVRRAIPIPDRQVATIPPPAPVDNLRTV